MKASPRPSYTPPVVRTLTVAEIMEIVGPVSCGSGAGPLRGADGNVFSHSGR